MEKIAIQLWKKNDIDEDEFKNFLVKKVPSSLADIVTTGKSLADFEKGA